MMKNNVLKIGGIIGVAAAIGLAVYKKTKKQQPKEEEIIEIEPEE